jgi:hypothetical protein
MVMIHKPERALSRPTWDKLLDLNCVQASAKDFGHLETLSTRKMRTCFESLHTFWSIRCSHEAELRSRVVKKSPEAELVAKQSCEAKLRSRVAKQRCEAESRSRVMMQSRVAESLRGFAKQSREAESRCRVAKQSHEAESQSKVAKQSDCSGVAEEESLKQSR